MIQMERGLFSGAENTVAISWPTKSFLGTDLRPQLKLLQLGMNLLSGRG